LLREGLSLSRHTLYQKTEGATTPIQVIFLHKTSWLLFRLIKLPIAVWNKSCRLHKAQIICERPSQNASLNVSPG